MAAVARLKTLLSWSSGKDSAWALHRLRHDERYEVAGLLCTINRSASRVAMHGVRDELLERQTAAARLPLWRVEIPSPCSNEEYEAAMRVVVARAIDEDVRCMAFGDLFLEDIRAYREEKLARTGMQAVFPLWGSDTRVLAKEMIDGGLRARIVCLDPRVMPRELAGRDFDASLLSDLPTTVDPCGERGEFHTFAYAGPMFHEPLAITVGETVERDGFVFTDLLPVALPAATARPDWRGRDSAR
jgi:uncharacterized protein (TIGR00290 family)